MTTPGVSPPSGGRAKSRAREDIKPAGQGGDGQRQAQAVPGDCGQAVADGQWHDTAVAERQRGAAGPDPRPARRRPGYSDRGVQRSQAAQQATGIAPDARVLTGRRGGLNADSQGRPWLFGLWRSDDGSVRVFLLNR